MTLNKLQIALAIICLLPLFGSASTTVNFGGREWQLTSNTILLDREGIYGNPDALTDPLEAFRRINEIGTDATLLVAPSVYWLDNPDDRAIRQDPDGTPYAVRIKCNNLNIIGLADNPQDVVFAVNRGQTQGAVGNFTMFHFTGEYFETANITYGNYCNTDLIYPRNPAFNREKRKSAIVQAQICICQNTDRVFAYNCQFLSRLNLCPFMNARRILFDHCYFESTDDALPGGAIYKDCSFTFFSSKPFYTTDETGAVFFNCDIRSLCNGPQYFTKVPGMVTAIDTRFTADNPVQLQWTRDPSDIISYQQNISLNGKPYTIDSNRPELGHDLSTSAIKEAYIVETEGKTIYNLPNLLGGNDGWDPLNYMPAIKEAEKQLGRKLTGLPVKLRLTTDKKKLEPQGDTASISLQPLLWGGYPAGAPSFTTYISDNKTPQPEVKTLDCKISDGLSGRISLDIKPLLRKAPAFGKKPEIRKMENGEYTVGYTLKGKGDDESTIMWGRLEKNANANQAILLKSAPAGEGKSYLPTAADFTESIFAVVVPKFADSHAGESAMAAPVAINDSKGIVMPESSLFTNFHDIPIVKRSPGLVGAWTFDVYKPEDTSAADWEAVDEAGWYWGRGFDASVSEGLNQNAKGSRITYIPMRSHTRDMHVRVVAEPGKNGGQGFGSATSQYMDICVKFDPVTLTGYALRIERTSDHDRAVVFSLVRYDHGHTSVLEKGVVSNCYRTPCTIDVEVKDGILHATATTEAEEARPCCEEVISSVDISAPVEESSLGGFAIQHTGSWGPSATLIKNLEIDWN